MLISSPAKRRLRVVQGASTRPPWSCCSPDLRKALTRLGARRRMLTSSSTKRRLRIFQGASARPPWGARPPARRGSSTLQLARGHLLVGPPGGVRPPARLGTPAFQIPGDVCSSAEERLLVCSPAMGRSLQLAQGRLLVCPPGGAGLPGGVRPPARLGTPAFQLPGDAGSSGGIRSPACQGAPAPQEVSAPVLRTSPPTCPIS